MKDYPFSGTPQRLRPSLFVVRAVWMLLASFIWVNARRWSWWILPWIGFPQLPMARLRYRGMLSISKESQLLITDNNTVRRLWSELILFTGYLMSRVPSYMLLLITNNNIYFIDREPAKSIKRYWNVDYSDIIEFSQGSKTIMSLCCVSNVRYHNVTIVFKPWLNSIISE